MRIHAWWIILLVVMVGLDHPASAQNVVAPPSISVDGGPVCSAGSQNFPVQLALGGTTFDKVDVFLLFDDTGSFAGFVPTVSSIFSDLVSALEAALPGVEFGFGVGRFEDYGGPGAGFSGEVTVGRPFILNQPIVTGATAGGSAARDLLITEALGKAAPGFGGDGPESAISEGLFQTATGTGFDGNGSGSALDSGAACAPATQTSPGVSGDVPPFSSCVALPKSGTLGGAGFRSGPGVLRIVILATDICPIAAYPGDVPIPASIAGAGGSSEPVSALACSTSPGVSRFGFVSDSLTTAGNTVPGAVAPAGAATVQAAVSALNALGIQVVGMGPGAAPTTSPGPSGGPSVWLSAMARLTGAVDESGTPLVFSTSVPLETLKNAIVDAIERASTRPVDVTLTHGLLPAGLSFTFTPPRVEDVGPGDTAAFTVTLTGNGSPIDGGFDIEFRDVASNAVLGAIPTAVDCSGPKCNGLPATVFVKDGVVVGGRLNGTRYRGVLEGTVGDDVVVGTDGKDLIKVYGGHDTICALGGNDVIEAGPGDDWIDGGRGHDLIKGQEGNDTILGGEGDDIIEGGPGDDWIDGGPGHDRIKGQEGSDTCLNGEIVGGCNP